MTPGGGLLSLPDPVLARILEQALHSPDGLGVLLTCKHFLRLVEEEARWPTAATVRGEVSKGHKAALLRGLAHRSRHLLQLRLVGDEGPPLPAGFAALVPGLLKTLQPVSGSAAKAG